LQELSTTTHGCRIGHHPVPINGGAAEADEFGEVEELPEVDEGDDRVRKRHELNRPTGHHEVREGVKCVVQDPMVEARNEETLARCRQGTAVPKEIRADALRGVKEGAGMDLDLELASWQMASGQVVVFFACSAVGRDFPAPRLEVFLTCVGLFHREQQVDISHDPESRIAGRRGEEVDATFQDKR
jgi:hypothetical protein